MPKKKKKIAYVWPRFLLQDKKGSLKNICVRRVYESVDDKSIYLPISPESMETEFERWRVKLNSGKILIAIEYLADKIYNKILKF